MLGSTLGTMIGVGIGSIKSWYIATYVMGALTIPIVPLCLKLPNTKSDMEMKASLKSVLKTGGVWACILVNVSNIFTLHTVLIGIPFCLAYTNLDQPSASGLAILGFVAVVGLLSRTAVLLVAKFSKKGPLSALNRRRFPIVIGKFMTDSAGYAYLLFHINKKEYNN
ncbi:hypothetical protein SK128_023958 [Halocaridina rubra]|uniref:Uncharacterized protein n=1 Tax=Halocaridina rubra TaxID=373956 RepID=A0AAN8WQB7_HALRR